MQLLLETEVGVYDALLFQIIGGLHILIGMTKIVYNLYSCVSACFQIGGTRNYLDCMFAGLVHAEQEFM